MTNIPSDPSIISDPAVAAVFASYPEPVKTRLLALRTLILETAAITAGVGDMEETLKWRQPSYLTTRSKSGTTIRIDQLKSDPRHYAMFVHCQTNLIETFSELYPGDLVYDGKRAVIFDTETDPPVEVLRHCISLALTYHLKKVRGH
ncbi:MAG: DUF1801 domain-containing protein [Fimbriimonadaceae bacterium]|nr:DUF1801 domain-containing protein [Alphaproteobacteria bacterium]